MFGGIIRLLYIVVFAWLLYKLVRALRRPSPKGRFGEAADPRSRRIEGGELVQDPQCGVYIPRETAIQDEDGNRFCSETCRDEYHRAERER